MAAPGLARHEGAQRDTRPAWMTKGLGVGTAMLGEATGDLVKPGMTRQQLEAIEARKGQPFDGPDPFGDVFKEARGAPPTDPRLRTEPKSAPPAVGKIGKAGAAPGVVGKAATLLPTSAKAVTPPWRAGKAAPDDDYDPFAELPSPQVVARTKVASPAAAAPPGKGPPPKATSSTGAIAKNAALAPSAGTGATPKPGFPVATAAAGPPPPAKTSSKAACAAEPPQKIAKSTTMAKAVLNPAAQPPPGAKTTMPKASIQEAPKKAPTESKAAAAAKLVIQAEEAEEQRRLNVERGKARRMESAASLATEKFKAAKSSDTSAAGAPAAKKARVEAGPDFSAELLDKAPSSLQTCRSLLQFLEKKLEATPAAPPEVGGPAALKARLQAFADSAGKLAAVSSGGWDARAKRVIDTAAAASSAAGKSLLDTAEKKQASLSEGLEKELEKLKSDDKLEDLVKDRRKWAQDTAKREFLSWCEKLLRRKEALLLKAAEGQEVKPTGSVGGTAVLQALLASR
eukprot:TRINITY_DN104298_c0_g1_i1.p1 TRINITY_DN104298_c0_g1~~TRINITY_DN104298_c0_g1_i1.p1  ORF type:complete len:513 (+),score=169.18 TRINITY_DN104298_c0_g1_i1:111-1649(+)